MIAKITLSFPALPVVLLLLAVAPSARSQTSAQNPAGEVKASVAREMPAASPTTESFLSSYDGENVTSVQIAGQPGLNPGQFTSLMEQKPGRPFSRDKVERTAAALRATGKFKEVRVQAEPEANGVRIVYVLEPAVWIGIYRFPGARRFAYSELVQVSNYPVQSPFNAIQIRNDGKSLEKFFRQEGFFEAQVRTGIQIDHTHSIANVDFHVTLSKQAKFGTVFMQGGTPRQEAQLEHKLTTLWARLRGTAIRPNKTFHHSTVAKATRYLQSILEGQGYLSAQVELVHAEYHPGSNRADILFKLEPGVKTRVKITGAHIWSWDKKGLLPMYQGVGVDRETVEEGRQALISYFQKKGYFHVSVNANFKAGPQGDTVLYAIDKEKKHKVTAIHVTGNKQIPSSKLDASIAIQKAHLFSHGEFSNDLMRTSINNLTAVYRAEGFSAVKVSSSVTTRNGNIQVTFRVVQGPRNIVNNVAIEGDKTFPESQFAPKGLKVRAGQPYSQAHVEEDRTTILANYLRAGYLNVSFRETASRVSAREPHRIDVVYHIAEGPRVTTGDVITLGRVHTQQRLIDNDVNLLKPGTPLTEADLLTAGANLYNHTGVFDWAEVDPKRQITTQTNEDVLVKVHESPRNEFQYGFGFEVIERGGSVPSGTVALPNLPPVGLPANFTTNESTFYGPRGTAQYTRNNIRGKGESLSVTAFAGRLDQRGAFYYIDPNFRWSAWKATTSASIERDEENPIFSSQIETGSVQFQRPVDRAKKNIAFFRYSYSNTNLTRVLLAQLVPAQDDHIKLSTLSANFTRDTRDNPLNEHRGVFDSVELDFNSSKLGSNVDFAKLTGQAAFYKTAFHNIVWADAIRIGLAQPFSGSFVPLSEQFFTGGGNSLRGIPLDSAGPQRSVYVCPNGTSSCGTTIPFPTGGNELLILNSEARIPLFFIKKGLRIVPFYDGGSVFPRIGFHDFTTLYTNNVGIGFTYNTPVGPIRFDLGKDLNPEPGTSPPTRFPLQYFIGIGQAF